MLIILIQSFVEIRRNFVKIRRKFARLRGNFAHLLDLSDPPADAALQRVQKLSILHFVAEIRHLGPPVFVLASFDDGRHVLVDGQRDLGDVDVLLQVQQTHLQFGNLTLHCRRHLVAIPAERKWKDTLVIREKFEGISRSDHFIT